MTTKDLHIALKRGSGVQYMMERHHFESEEALFEAIQHLTPSGAPTFITNLKKNQKRLDKKTRNVAVVEGNKTDSEEKLTEQFSEEETAYEVASEENSAIEVEGDEEDETEALMQVSLEQLLADEHELSVTAMQLESAHKEKVAQSNELNKRLISSQKVLDELMRIIKYQKENVEQLSEEYKEIHTQMLIINRDRAACIEMLDLIRAQIAELKKITILVYRNGNIEVENAKIPSISDESFNAKFTELISYPDAEEYTIKELKTIAKVCLMVEQFEQGDEKFEVVFEKTELQSFFENAIAKPTIE